MDITTIILDILENSIEAEAKNLSVLIIDDGEKIVLSIYDDGQGMSEETLSKAGLPGFSTKNTNRGMGLFKFRQFLKEHEGAIKLSSKQYEGTKLDASWKGSFSKEFLAGLAQSLIVLFSNADDIKISFVMKNKNKQIEFLSKDLKNDLGIQSFKDCQSLEIMKNMFIENIKFMEEDI